MKRWFGLVFTIAVAFGGLSWLSPFCAAAATNTVLNLDDSGAGSLRSVIQNSAPGDKVVFTNGLTGSLNLTSGEILLDKNLTIAGPGSDQITLLGNVGVGRAFRVTNAVVSISGLAIWSFTVRGLSFEGQHYVGGYAYGGAILNSGTLSLTDCRLAGNSASGGVGGGTSFGGLGGGSGRGGAIANIAGGSLALIRCRLDGNGTWGGTGGADVRGFMGGPGGAGIGAAVYSESGLTITDCWFESNYAIPGAGGSGSPNGPLGFALGGALHANGNPVARVSGSTFDGNSAYGTNARAGAIWVAGGTVSLNNCTLSGNSAGGAGGAIELAPTTALRCTNSTISANSAPQGGGVNVPTNSSAHFRNTIIAQNTATLGAGFGHDVFGPAISAGFNLVGNTNGSSGFTNATDQVNVLAALGSLQDNGGPTPTMALLPGSPAIDRGKSFGLTTDQRGEPRPFDFASIANASGGDGSDIGAFEVGRPKLNIQQAGNSAVLSWPSYSAEFALQSSTNVTSSNCWINAGGTTTVVGDQYQQTNGPISGNRFFRLRGN